MRFPLCCSPISILNDLRFVSLAVDKLAPKLPIENPQIFLWNSGSEANEAAVKIVRRATGKNNIIVMQGSYHGRTYGASALTKSKTIYSQNVGSVMPGYARSSTSFALRCRR